jgi:hypothetical protein
LMACDRLHRSRLNATQQQLGEMLGVGRSTIALIAGDLQRRGRIRYTRGNLAVSDRAALEKVACECYVICRSAMGALFEKPPLPRSSSTMLAAAAS